MINVDKFPDMKKLVNYGHSKNVKMGWYLNGCACGERKERLLNYQGDIQRLHEFGFDAAKFDGCGAGRVEIRSHDQSCMTLSLYKRQT